MSNLSVFMEGNQDDSGLLDFNNKVFGTVREILTGGFNAVKNDTDDLDNRVNYLETGLKWKIGEYKGTGQSSTSTVVQTVNTGFVPDIVFVLSDSTDSSSYVKFTIRRTGEVVTDNTTDSPIGNLIIPTDGTTGFYVKSYLNYYKYPHQYLAIKFPEITTTKE